ncbi:hypothetical protein [Streptomyces sp. DSM 118878]
MDVLAGMPGARFTENALLQCEQYEATAVGSGAGCREEDFR